MSEHVLVTDAKAETKHVGVRQYRAQHGQKPETRGHATSSKALPEQGSDEPVRDNRRHKDQFGWRWQINAVVHSVMLRGHSGFFSVKRLVSSGSASGTADGERCMC